MRGPLNSHDLYDSQENHELVSRTLGLQPKTILDVGAGTGKNLLELQKIHPEARSVAITCSVNESERLKNIAHKTIVADLNLHTDRDSWRNSGLAEKGFDLILLSHVLEHLLEPERVLESISSLLSPNGVIIVALPNICHWRARLRIARGCFEYQDSGPFDKSHLRFYTYWSAIELVQDCPTLDLLSHWPLGGAILGPLRTLLPKQTTSWIDQHATQYWPNLFGFETHLVAKHK